MYMYVYIRRPRQTQGGVRQGIRHLKTAAAAGPAAELALGFTRIQKGRQQQQQQQAQQLSSLCS